MDEKYLEQASQLAADRVSDSLKLSAEALSGTGTDECIKCGCDIGPERKQAMPSAMRCVFCQTIFERHGK